MRARLSGLLFILALVGLSGCAGMQPTAAQRAPEPLPIPTQPVPRGQSGGVFVPQLAGALTSDSRAFRPGDVLTVVLQEVTQASKAANTKIGKGSSVGVDAPVIAGHTLKADVSLGAQRDFAGTATSSQSNALQGSVTVVVNEVLPNGLLRVEGDKRLYLNQGEETLHVAGYIRADDIDADNRVSSQRIANARIAYSGQGTLADSNSPGWLTRFFTSPWMPF